MHLVHHITHEHKHLRPNIDQLKETADAIGIASDEETHQSLMKAHEFLKLHLIPHAMGEDKALYPLVAKYMGAPEATATMTREHEEVAAMTRRLEQLVLPPHDQAALREVLYGLYALISLHFAKEEELYLPILRDNLTHEDDEQAFNLMEATHRKASEAAS